MIGIPGGWVQWDSDLGTFRACVEGRIYGTYSGEIVSVDAISQVLFAQEGIELSTGDKADLAAQKEAPAL